MITDRRKSEITNGKIYPMWNIMSQKDWQNVSALPCYTIT